MPSPRTTPPTRVSVCPLLRVVSILAPAVTTFLGRSLIHLACPACLPHCTADVKMSADGRSRGWGIVRFATPAEAAAAVAGMNGAEVAGRAVQVCGSTVKP